MACAKRVRSSVWRACGGMRMRPPRPARFQMRRPRQVRTRAGGHRYLQLLWETSLGGGRKCGEANCPNLMTRKPYCDHHHAMYRVRGARVGSLRDCAQGGAERGSEASTSGVCTIVRVSMTLAQRPTAPQTYCWSNSRTHVTSLRVTSGAASATRTSSSHWVHTRAALRCSNRCAVSYRAAAVVTDTQPGVERDLRFLIGARGTMLCPGLPNVRVVGAREAVAHVLRPRFPVSVVSAFFHELTLRSSPDDPMGVVEINIDDIVPGRFARARR